VTIPKNWSSHRSRDSCSGQAAIELALSLPLLALLLIGVIQVGLMVREQLHLEFVVSEAARAASRSVDAESAAVGVATAALIRSPTEVSVTVLPGPYPGAEMVRVQIVTTSHTSVPLLGALFSQRELRAATTMAREPP